MIEYGLCECGCNQRTNLAPQTVSARGYKKGEPRRFIRGHHLRSGEKHPAWRGARQQRGGYITIFDPSHPRSNKQGRVFEQVKIATRAFGKPLPPKALVHHVNGNKADNHTPFNLVVCQGTSYHQVLHRRTKALRECGHANWRRCHFCHQWDDPENLYIHEGHWTVCHRLCHNKYNKKRYAVRGKELPVA